MLGMTQKEENGSLKTTKLSLSIILEYIEDVGGAPMAEIVNEFDLPKSTAHNHLSTFIIRDI